MKKLTFALIFSLLLPLTAHAAVPDNTFCLSLNCYNQDQVQQAYCFNDGNCYDLKGSFSFKRDISPITQLPVNSPVPQVTPVQNPIDNQNPVTPVVTTHTPDPNVIVPQQTLPSDNPTKYDVCPSIDGDQATLPQGMILYHGQCFLISSLPADQNEVPIAPYFIQMRPLVVNNQGLTIVAQVAGGVMPKLEFSTNADMSDAKLEFQRGSGGNTIDTCPGVSHIPSDPYNFSNTYSQAQENFLSNTTYYFRIRFYQCSGVGVTGEPKGIANMVNPLQLLLGQSDIMSFTTK